MTTIEVLKWNIFFQKGDDMLLLHQGRSIVVTLVDE
jgi:hypothetical protein